MSERGSMPEALAIAEYWYENQPHLATMVRFLSAPACMACGWFPNKPPEAHTNNLEARWGYEYSKLEKAHIVPDALGGSTDVSNLVMLCKPCHLASPDVTDPSEMMKWISTREDNTLRSQRYRALEDHPDYAPLMTAIEADFPEAIDRAIELAGEWVESNAGVHDGRFSPGTYAAAGVYGLRRALQEARANVWHDDLLALLDTEGGSA